MKRIEVSYTEEMVNESAVVSADGCNSISFSLEGDTPAYIRGIIPLTEKKPVREFENSNPLAVIKDSFKIVFDDLVTTKEVLVVKTFVKVVG